MGRFLTGLLIVILLGAVGLLGYASKPTYETAMLRGNSFDPSWGTAEGSRWGLQHMAELFPARTVHRGGPVSPLGEAPMDLSGFSYEFEGKTHTLDDFHSRNDTQAMIILHKGKVVYETYRHGTGSATRFTSMSVAKSITATLLGIARDEGLITSFEDPIDQYLPTLVGTAYEGVSIKHVLQMSSGVAFNEEYGPDNTSDVADFFTFSLMGNFQSADALAIQYPTGVAPGSKFNYSTAETQVLSALLREVTGMKQADYLTEKLWRPLGMSHDATWLIDKAGPDGDEMGGCCLNAALRDYARLGLLYLNDGMVGDRRILPAGWVGEATVPSDPQVMRGALYEDSPMGYQYQWWAYPGTAYAAEGVFGQFIYIDPAKDIVIAKNSAWPEGWIDAYGAEAGLVFSALGDYLNAQTDMAMPANGMAQAQ
ncbi:MAG: serine hydrolase [Alphaproteobacteria bacterium]